MSGMREGKDGESHQSQPGDSEKEQSHDRRQNRRGRRGLSGGPSNPFICQTGCKPSIVLVSIVIAGAPLPQVPRVRERMTLVLLPYSVIFRLKD